MRLTHGLSPAVSDDVRYRDDLHKKTIDRFELPTPARRKFEKLSTVRVVTGHSQYSPALLIFCG